MNTYIVHVRDGERIVTFTQNRPTLLTAIIATLDECRSFISNPEIIFAVEKTYGETL